MALFWFVHEIDGRVLISARAARRVAAGCAACGRPRGAVSLPPRRADRDSAARADLDVLQERL